MDAMLVLEDGRDDGTCEGFVGCQARVLAVKFHPESSPGPRDSFGMFHEFGQPARAAAGCGQPRVEELP